MLLADGAAEIAGAARAYVAARGARSQVISGDRFQRGNRSYGAYGGPRKARPRDVACARTRLRRIPTSRTSRALCAASGASLYNRRRLAEFFHLKSASAKNRGARSVFASVCGNPWRFGAGGIMACGWGTSTQDLHNMVISLRQELRPLAAMHVPFSAPPFAHLSQVVPESPLRLAS